MVYGLGIGDWGLAFGAAPSVPNDTVRCGDPGENTEVYCVI